MKHPSIVKIFLFIFIYYWTPNIFIQSYSLRHVEFFVNSSGKCPEDDNNPVHFIGTFSRAAWNKYVINGDLAIYEKISGNIMFQLTAKRCKLDLTECVDYDKIRINNICGLLKQKNQMIVDLLNKMEPKLECPIEKGAIKITNGTIDLTSASRFAISGYTWVSHMRFYEEISKSKRKKQLMCLMQHTTISESRKGLKTADPAVWNI